ncbi:Calcium/calmodulin-dependent protein kinase type 1 [Tulasnella sp. JGI-2019a]|nr:Calcium/calmodulin-dependent protein kinase type 1 [Tulasnella sp. JGI-2019a]
MPRASPHKPREKDSGTRRATRQPLKAPLQQNLPSSTHERQPEDGPSKPQARLTFPLTEPESIYDYKKKLEHRTAGAEPEEVTVTGGFRSCYRLVEFIARGGYGQVIKVRKLSDDSVDLACKIIECSAPRPHPNSVDPQARRAWERGVEALTNEADLWGQLNHRNLIRLDDSIREGEGKIYLFMSYAKLGALTKFPVEDLSPEEALVFIAEILEGVLYLHEKGIIHRDLKPDNILLTIEDDKRKVMVADFGASKQAETFTNRVGTQGWMAPEVEEGKQKCDNKVDIYGIGLISWWMLFGSTYSKDSNWDVVTEKITSENDASQVKDFLSKLLESDPAQRWTAEMARNHPLVRGYKWSTVAPGEPVAEDAALSDVNAAALPALPAVLAEATPIQPVGDVPEATELSENIVEAMLFRSILTPSVSEGSETPSFHIALSPTPDERKRDPNEVDDDGERSAKRRKGNPPAHDESV